MAKPRLKAKKKVSVTFAIQTKVTQKIQRKTASALGLTVFRINTTEAPTKPDMHRRSSEQQPTICAESNLGGPDWFARCV